MLCFLSLVVFVLVLGTVGRFNPTGIEAPFTGVTIILLAWILFSGVHKVAIVYTGKGHRTTGVIALFLWFGLFFTLLLGVNLKVHVPLGPITSVYQFVVTTVFVLSWPILDIFGARDADKD